MTPGIAERERIAAKLVELCGDGPMPRNVAQACSFKFWLAREIRKAIR